MTHAARPAEAVAPTRAPLRARLWRGLSAKFLLLTILFVMLVEMAILVPSVANFRQTWLMGRLDQSRAALGVLDRTLGDEMMRLDLLDAFDAHAIVLREGERTVTVSRTETLPDMATVVREADLTALDAIGGAWAQLTAPPMSFVHIVGDADRAGRRIELVLNADALRADMLRYMRNIVLISLLIAVATSLLIFASVRSLMIRPIQRMAEAMTAFGAAPQDTGRIIRPERREDELGVAQRQLADMQRQIHATLQQQKRLAELGLAVSKINHDMRNILSTASLVTERLADVDDPVVRRVAPRLVRALDRAVTYSEGVLEFGRAGEAAPRREPTDMRALGRDVRDLALPEGDEGIAFDVEAAEGLALLVDREQMLRVLLNLARNAVQAIHAEGGGAGGARGEAGAAGAGGRAAGERGRITLAAAARGSTGTIELRDTGPGLPAGAADTLFAPFAGSTTRGGSGLGLAIARELVEAHGGTIAAAPNAPRGTRIVIELPGAAMGAVVEGRS